MRNRSALLAGVRRSRFRRAALASALATVLGCGSRLPEVSPAPPERHYKPGESIADARVCACRECVKSSCCRADDEPTASVTELGLTVPTCGGCYRRVWTVRGDRTCESTLPSECCELG